MTATSYVTPKTIMARLGLRKSGSVSQSELDVKVLFVVAE